MLKYVGFRQFQTKVDSEDDIIQKIESLFENDIPPIFRIFLETFKLDFNRLISERYLHKSKNLFEIPYWNWKIDEEYSKLGFGDFLSVNRIIDIVSEQEPKQELVPIAYCGGFNGGVSVDISGAKSEEVNIIYYSRVKQELLSTNIFYFIRKYFLHEVDLDVNFQFDSLVRYWGNQYWNIDGWEELKPYDSHPIPGEPFYRYIPERGFILIGTRRLDEEFNFKPVENVLALPFRFRLFLEHFKFEGEKGLFLDKIYDAAKDQMIHFGRAIFEPFEVEEQALEVHSFYKEDEFQQIVQQLPNNKLWTESKLVPIGTTNLEGIIGVRLEDEGKEEIWLAYEVNDQSKMIKLADDIFKFIRSLIPVYDEQYFDQIYQKWGDDFWRLKAQ